MNPGGGYGELEEGKEVGDSVEYACLCIKIAIGESADLELSAERRATAETRGLDRNEEPGNGYHSSSKE